eukprot:5133727-Karenia_brevis.AAC.1
MASRSSEKGGRQYVQKVTDPEFSKSSGDSETLDAKVGTALSKILHGEVGRKFRVEEDWLANEGKLIKGRQITLYVYEHYA